MKSEGHMRTSRPAFTLALLASLLVGSLSGPLGAQSPPPLPVLRTPTSYEKCIRQKNQLLDEAEEAYLTYTRLHRRDAFTSRCCEEAMAWHRRSAELKQMWRALTCEPDQSDEDVRAELLAIVGKKQALQVLKGAIASRLPTLRYASTFQLLSHTEELVSWADYTLNSHHISQGKIEAIERIVGRMNGLLNRHPASRPSTDQAIKGVSAVFQAAMASLERELAAFDAQNDPVRLCRSCVDECRSDFASVGGSGSSCPQLCSNTLGQQCGF